MKAISTIILAIFLLCNLVAAQDTLYIYKSGTVVTKRAVNDIDSVIFYKALDPATVADIDGNVYNTVTIGTQVWMVENLKTTKYNDGTSIPNITDGTTWTNLTTPGYCFYNNDAANKNIYGALYNWYTVNTNKLAPTGWHVPTNAEWNILTTYLTNNGYGYGGSGSDIAKSMASAFGWNSCSGVGTVGNDPSSNNSSGFAGLPGGYRGTNGAFNNIGNYGSWWSSIESNSIAAWYRDLADINSAVYRGNAGFYKQIGCSVRCLRDDNTPVLDVLTLSTTPANNIKTTSAISGGIITNDGGSAITARGVCWNTSSSPTTANSKTTDGTGLGDFTSSITDLTANTPYYVRAYATNSVGTSYGSTILFTTLSEETVADIDGNIYTTVTIGTQTWMVENLKTTKYNDGTSIPFVSDGAAWSNLITPGYCFYNNDAANKNIYGALYNWYTVNTNKLAPTGWHVPTNAEWTILTTYLTNNGYGYGGIDSDIAKSMAYTSGWHSCSALWTVGNDPSSNNSSGFAGLPGGYRAINGIFWYIGDGGYWWSSSQPNTYGAWSCFLNYNYSFVDMDNYRKWSGFSVRCVRDEAPILSTTAVSDKSITSATCGGTITSNGGAPITVSGVCWNTTGSPTTADSKTTDGTLAGPFRSTMNGLTANATYYVRAYATNSVGTTYGNEVSFTSNSENTVTDIDGNIYHTVTIGTQTWMVENLKTTKYNDGMSIPFVTDATAWASLTTPGYCYYNNDAANKTTYGALYNWYTVNTGNLTPTSWHVPTDAEWTTLENYLIANGYNYDGTTTGNKIAKSLAATTLWNTYSTVGAIGNDLTKNNTSGFAGLPGGYRANDGTFGGNGANGTFSLIGITGNWWSSTQTGYFYAWYRNLACSASDVGRSYAPKQCGFSVRCVRDF